MDPLKVKDRILENISLSVKKLQSYFAACEDETPAIRNHDRVLQRLCEHLDHALLYGLQDISSGYWVLVLHFTRKEAVRQIDELQHIATNLGRSRAWLYLALSESSLESYLRLFQENQALLQKYYFKNALVCSHDHLTLFLTLVSGLEFIRFDLELDVPYLDVAPYMPEYYKPQNLLDFEERLPSSDSLSLHSFTSLTSTNLEWDDSAIAPSSEEGDLTDPASCPRSSGSDPQTVVGDSVILRSAAAVATVSVAPMKAAPPPSPPHSPVFRHNPFNHDSDTNTSADVTPVHVAGRQGSCAPREDGEGSSTQLEVIRLAKRRKPAKKRRVKSSSGSISSVNNNSSSDLVEPEESLPTPEPEGARGAAEEADSSSSSLPHGGAATRRTSRRSTDEEEEEEEEEEPEPYLRLPQMTDTSMDGVGRPLRDVMDRLNGARESEEAAEAPGAAASNGVARDPDPQPPTRQPFREEAGREPPDRADGEPPGAALARGPAGPYASDPAGPYASGPRGTEPAAPGGGGHDPAGSGESEAVEGAAEDAGAAAAEEGPEPALRADQGEGGADLRPVGADDAGGGAEEQLREEMLGPAEDCHPAEFKVDNNHLLLLMIHVFRENEEQLYKMMKMSTGHMEGDLQPLYLLLTDCYIYLLRKGAAEKPYTVEEAVSYNELDYISVGLDQQTVMLVCTNRRRQFLLDAADFSLTIWLLEALRSAMVKGCREPPYPSVLTDATMEKLALTKFVSQEAHCEVSEVSIQLYSLVHWEDPMDAALSPHGGPPGSGSSSTKEGCLLYRAGTNLLGKELWKSCYLVLSNGILYQYAERTDIAPVLSITMGGERCGGCRRSNSTERPHAFHVVLIERPPLELSANDEQDMGDWMLLLCQAASKGVIPQGSSPTPCIPCCLVVTEGQLLTCHQDCQTSFFRSLGMADLSDVTGVRLEADQQYCVVEFAGDRAKFLPPWVLYFSGCGERDRLLEALDAAWREIFQVVLPRGGVEDPAVRKRCREALALMSSAWQRADSLARGRAQREPWC
ncbi:pleckstrin homology domain-containing family M member 2 isoform X2 [Gadus macrocephalus]|uniref:pleckstrin homology domain-containing family M member 2 isoform X2 n=1 Tax=Gadus macrocephalus TaxID=80720 RepID=UPI0028CB40A2|nr:pleckstrin homology domain-containing family M member 2 isoform X2 [Gadus macrocephalus]